MSTQIRWPLLCDTMEAEQHEDEPWGADALAVEAVEYVAAEAAVEPFWKAMLGVIGIVITAIGLPVLFTLMEH